MLSIPHMIVVFVVVLVVFGPKKLPELARGLGKLMAEFRKASLDFKTAFEEEMRDLERQALVAERKKAAEAAAASAAAEPVQAAATPSPSETNASETSAATQSTEVPETVPAAEPVARGDAFSEDHKTEAAPQSENDATTSASLQGSAHDPQPMA